MGTSATAQDVLKFWFDDTEPQCWFKKDAAFDAAVTAKFEKTVANALGGRCDQWADAADGCLALIIVLDQFTRNIFRESQRAFSGDEMALALSLRCVERGYITHPNPQWRQFMLMPMMHSEDLAIQDAALPLFDEHTNSLTYDYAIKHRDIIARFGRFPHRNNVLWRPSTDAEIEFLTQPGSSF